MRRMRKLSRKTMTPTMMLTIRKITKMVYKIGYRLSIGQPPTLHGIYL